MRENTERLDAIQKRVDAATPGPWFAEGEPATPMPRTVYYVFHNGDTLDRDRIADSFGADAEFIAAAPSDVAFLLDLARKQGAAIEAVRALHKPEKRWMPYEGAGISYDTEREALEATEDVDLNSVVIEEIAENGVPYFEVCAHCKHIEDAPCEGECTLEAGYRESIWPCPTIAVLELTP